MRPSLIIVVLVGAVFGVIKWGLRGAQTNAVVELPANYVSVGQEFDARVLNLTPQSTVAFELHDASGRPVSRQTATAADDGTGAQARLSLPKLGRYSLRASGDWGAQNVAITAMAEPPPLYGGVRPLAALGLDSGAEEYLRAHGFALSAFAAQSSVGAIVVGDPRLDGDDLVATYAQLWQQVAAGANVLLLQPPPPAVARMWPLTASLAAAPADCGADLFDSALTAHLEVGGDLATLLHPALVFDLASEKTVDIYHWDGTRMPRLAPQAGYGGCHALFSFRYGDGWVTVSTLPLLQRFQDTRARLYLMNLLKAITLRKRPVPASPGLQWVMEQRLRAANLPAPPALAAFYQPAPQALAPAAVLAPAVTDGNSQSCFHAADQQRAGAAFVINVAQPLRVQGIALDFGAQPGNWPANFALETRGDGGGWQPVSPTPVIAPSGRIEFTPTQTEWVGVRLRLTADVTDRGWGLCEATLTPAPAAPIPAAH